MPAMKRARSAPKRAARLDVSNVRLERRREAVRKLNAILDTLPVAFDKLAVKSFTMEDLERLLRLLNHRCVEDDSKTLFREAVKLYVDNGGQLPDGLRFEGDRLEDSEGASAAPTVLEAAFLPRHKVLKVDFRLHSKAFMVTHNGRSLTVEMWPAFKQWAETLASHLKARAWAACMERSENAADTPQEGPSRFHTHSYFYWADDIGVYLRNLDRLTFAGIQPKA